MSVWLWMDGYTQNKAQAIFTETNARSYWAINVDLTGCLNMNTNRDRPILIESYQVKFLRAKICVRKVLIFGAAWQKGVDMTSSGDSFSGKNITLDIYDVSKKRCDLKVIVTILAVPNAKIETWQTREAIPLKFENNKLKHEWISLLTDQ